MLRRLPIPFSQFFGIMSFLAMLTIGSDSTLISSVIEEKVNNGGDLYYGAAFIKELENLIKNFEYTF